MDFESWDNSIADENSNLHLVRYGPKGDSTNCFMIPLYYLTKDSTRKNALKEHLNAYVEEHSKLEKEPKLIVADFMMRTGKDDHGDPAGQRVFTGPDGKERIYSPLVLNTKGPDNSRVGKMLDTSAHQYLDVGLRKPRCPRRPALVGSLRFRGRVPTHLPHALHEGGRRPPARFRAARTGRRVGHGMGSDRQPLRLLALHGRR